MIYRARFPEDFWQAQNKEIYNKEVEGGYEILASLSFKVVGLARNVERPLAQNMLRLRQLKEYCKKLSWCVYTNDNTDKTLEVLRYNEDFGHAIHDILDKKEHGSVECFDRYRDMAWYRNQYLNQIQYTGADIILVMDFDTHGFSYDGIAHSVYHMMNKSLDCIGANGLLYREYEGRTQRLYYDTLAFRRLNRKYGKPHDGEEINLMNYNRGQDLLKVQSAFGGMCLYNRKFINMKYLEDDCDHVTINRDLKEVYMNPSLIVLYSNNPYTV
jgi:hypothetical protein